MPAQVQVVVIQSTLILYNQPQYLVCASIGMGVQAVVIQSILIPSVCLHRYACIGSSHTIHLNTQCASICMDVSAVVIQSTLVPSVCLHRYVCIGSGHTINLNTQCVPPQVWVYRQQSYNQPQYLVCASIGMCVQAVVIQSTLIPSVCLHKYV